MSMVTLSWIAHTGYLLQEPQQNITNPDLMIAALVDQVQDTTMKTGSGGVVPDHSLIFTDIVAQVIMTHTEVTPGHNIGIIAATPGLAHNTHVPHIEITVIDPAMIHHTNLIAYHPHIEVPELTIPKNIADHVHVPPTNHQGEFCIGHTHTPGDHESNHTTRRTLE